MGKTITDEKPRVYFDCSKCVAFCCAIYERVAVNKRDLNRLAKFFGVSVEIAAKRYTTMYGNERVLRRKKDVIFEKSCKFLDPTTRGCTIYDGRPQTCREYPARSRCSYYDVLRFERIQQDDPDVMPLVQITFLDAKPPAPSKNGNKRVRNVASTNGTKRQA